MSYARFGWGGSDVYVYLDVGGYLTCCGCSESITRFLTTEDMLKHLEWHKQQGDTVPDDCIEDLKQDREENDKWLKSINKISIRQCSAKPYGVGKFPNYEHFFTVTGWRPIKK